MLSFTAFVLRIMVILMPVVGFQIVGSGYFTATGQPKKSIVLSLSRQILFLIPLMFILPETLPSVIPMIDGLDALYIATPASDALAIILTSIFVVREWHALRRREALTA